MFDNLAVVLCRPKISENVGAAARACANMGCPNLVLVDPARFDPDRAAALATGKGAEVLAAARLVPSLPEALAGFEKTYGATARLGGWRKAPVAPGKAAPRIVSQLGEGLRVALVFGPEQAGLTNEETRLLGTLLTIPTAPGASSLNLAQAVLLVLYECLLASANPAPRAAKPSKPEAAGGLVSHAEQEILFAALKEALLAIDFLKDDNPDYWMLPVRGFFYRRDLTRSERNMLLGICRQIKWIASQRK